MFRGRLHRRHDTAILVDVGTNAEVVLGNEHWLIGCAGAAGPALEGGVTRMGMLAGPGVIDRVTIDPGSLGKAAPARVTRGGFGTSAFGSSAS